MNMRSQEEWLTCEQRPSCVWDQLIASVCAFFPHKVEIKSKSLLKIDILSTVAA